jgi:hypothetical protein
MAMQGIRKLVESAKKAYKKSKGKSSQKGKPKNQRVSKKKQVTKRKPSEAKTTTKANPPAGGKKAPAKRSTTSPRAKRAADSRRKRQEKVVQGEQKIMRPKRLTDGRSASRSKSPVHKKRTSYKKPALVAAGAATGLTASSMDKDKKEPSKSNNKGTVNRKSVKTVSKPKTKQSFGAAFKAARAAGKKQFTWNGKKYHTRTKEEEAKRKAKSKPKEPVVKGITYHAKKMAKEGKK